jgi:tetratricopeptide (TPR) repeat protein
MATSSSGEAVTDGGPSGLAARVTARLAADDADGALAAASTYLSLRPDDAHALQFCAIVERRFQRHAKSFALLGRSLRAAPDDGAIRRTHDDIVKGTLAQLLRMADGEPLLVKALCDLLPLAGLSDADTAILEQVRGYALRALLHQGVEYHQAGRWEEAAARYRAVLEIDPRHADALHLLGKIDRQQGRPLSALERIAAALDIGGLPPEVEHSLRACLNDLFQELQRSYDARDFRTLLHSASRIQSLCGQHLPAPYRDFMSALLHNASFPLYPEQGDHGLALACSEAAFALTPSPQICGQIYNQLRLLRLGTRDYARAWNPKDWVLVHADLPEVWDGSPCRSLLVINSNGLGDFLQFLRFLPEAVRRVERVFLRVRPDLLPLIRHSPLLRGVTMVPPGTPVEAERECELVGLPNILGLDPLRVPLPAPSFPLPADLVADWRRVVRRSDRPHIGLVWAVDAQNPRSVGLAPLLPVITGNGAGSGAVFVALQNNEAKAELLGRSLPDNLQDFGIQGLPNLAAIMMACDLVISVDCGLAHLACTLGLECWVMVQRHCDWRWHLEGDRCDWYPRARVFRQADQGDWTAVTGALEDALRLRFPTPAPAPAGLL